MSADPTDPAVLGRGHARLAEALHRRQLQPEESLALTELLGVVGIADAVVRTGTVSLPVLAGQLLAVVEAYRTTLAELVDGPSSAGCPRCGGVERSVYPGARTTSIYPADPLVGGPGCPRTNTSRCSRC